MKRCLDTCAYSKFMLGHPPLQACLEKTAVLILPVVVLGELHAGFEGGSKKKVNEVQLAEFLDLPSVRIAEMTHAIARRYASLHVALRKAGTPIPTNDIWIAAMAMELNAPLITYDAHFKKVAGLRVEMP